MLNKTRAVDHQKSLHIIFLKSIVIFIDNYLLISYSKIEMAIVKGVLQLIQIVCREVRAQRCKSTKKFWVKIILANLSFK